MAYDPLLAQRIRDLLSGQSGVTEMKMFGGIGFLINGNMACGILGKEMTVRVGPERYDATLKMPYARPFDFGGRTRKGWVYVEPAGFESDNDLSDWVQRGIAYASRLPAKQVKG